MRFCASLIALSEIKLRKLSFSYDPTDRIGAQDQIAQAAVKGEVSPAFSTSRPTPKTSTLTSTPTRFRSTSSARKICAHARGRSRRSTPLCVKLSPFHGGNRG